jgi:hypothetical protein
MVGIVQLMKYLLKKPSSGILRRVTLVRTDISEESSAAIIRVTRVGALETTLAVIGNQSTLLRHSIPSQCHPDNGGATFLRNVGSYKSHAA